MGANFYVHYGCGFAAPKEWLNFDASLTLRWERAPIIGRAYTKNSRRFPPNVRWGNIVSGLPLGDASCRGVYASHVLEHFALDDLHRALQNTKRIMEPGALFRLVVPDLEWAAREYIGRLQAGEPEANSFFLRETRLGEERRPRGPIQLVHSLLRTSRHLWMWDGPSLARALCEQGFSDVRRCSFGDSGDPMFALVEDRGRFEHAVALECRR
jgi:hypothetical protein